MHGALLGFVFAYPVRLLGKSGSLLLMAGLKIREDSAIRQGRSCKARFQEKFLKLITRKPYRKPTQVVRSRRPRRTSECIPRNSAKKRP